MPRWATSEARTAFSTRRRMTYSLRSKARSSARSGLRRRKICRITGSVLRAVARVGLAAAGPAVLQVDEDLDRLAHQVVRPAAVQVHDEADAAGVVLEARVVQALLGGEAIVHDGHTFFRAVRAAPLRSPGSAGGAGTAAPFTGASAGASCWQSRSMKRRAAGLSWLRRWTMPSGRASRAPYRGTATRVRARTSRRSVGSGKR